jgi:REP element-mobilizing transposase RayT
MIYLPLPLGRLVIFKEEIMLERASRKTLRIKKFDYKSAGQYFITFCTEGRRCLFGDRIESRVHLNEAGNILYQDINTIKNRYYGVDVDAFVIMPNHVHAIIILDSEERKRRSSSTDVSLSDIVRNIKTYTTTAYIKGVHEKNWEPFHKRLWQRSYHEHIIRNDKSLENIRRYIIDNPKNWDQDQENPFLSVSDH